MEAARCGSVPMENLRSFRILLIEDNLADVLLFRRALEEVGLNFELIVLEDGSDALHLINEQLDGARSGTPDLVILDLWLPKTDGETVLRTLRQSPRFTDVPVVIASSRVFFYPARPNLAHLRVAHFLIKPIDLRDYDEIGVVLKNILMEHSQLRISAATISRSTQRSPSIGRLSLIRLKWLAE